MAGTDRADVVAWPMATLLAVLFVPVLVGFAVVGARALRGLVRGDHVVVDLGDAGR